MAKVLRIINSFLLLGIFTLTVNSCTQEDDPKNSSGIITGTVLDDAGQPLADVTVTISGISEDDVSVTTGGDGKYTVENVSLKLHAVTFSKTDWLTTSKSVTADDFDAEKVATVNVTMVEAIAKIMGTITDAKNNGAPLSGVTVSVVGITGTVTSGSDGTYLFENLVEDDYTVTFEKDDYVTVTKQVSADDFVNDVVTLNITLGGQELLRGLTADQLANADKWYYNEYRGGRNADAYPHWDWACDYMCTLDFQGAWDEQNEGTTLQIRNTGTEQNNPADLNVFDSYVYGSKLITDDNKILSLRARTHSADETNHVYFGVQVVDLSAAQPAAVKIADKTFASENYTDFEFDLSAYVGREVIVAIGIYRQQTGDYWKQLVLRAIRFADVKVSNWDWLPGTEVVSGWKLTQETVRSTMPHTKKSFTGISPQSGNRDNYKDAYRAWRDVAHVGYEWHFVPLKKDPEVFPSEGYLIKTNGSAGANTLVPEAYLYAKFAVATGNNQLTFTTRNFGSNYTFFKVTAIEDNGTVTHLTPASNTAQEASAGADGTWKFKHGNGGAGTPNDYAAFVYDLSAYNGQDVTIVIGVYKGEANGDENKLVFHTIKMN